MTEPIRTQLSFGDNEDIGRYYADYVWKDEGLDIDELGGDCALMWEEIERLTAKVEQLEEYLKQSYVIQDGMSEVIAELKGATDEQP